MISYAIVKKVSALKAWVVVPSRTGRSVEYGPCDVMEGPWTPELKTEDGGATSATDSDGDVHDHPNHKHALGLELKAGDTVVVGFLDGNKDRPVVLGRIRP